MYRLCCSTEDTPWLFDSMQDRWLRRFGWEKGWLRWHLRAAWYLIRKVGRGLDVLLCSWTLVCQYTGFMSSWTLTERCRLATALIGSQYNGSYQMIWSWSYLPCTVLYQCNWKLPSWIRSCQVSKANIFVAKESIPSSWSWILPERAEVIDHKSQVIDSLSSSCQVVSVEVVRVIWSHEHGKRVSKNVWRSTMCTPNRVCIRDRKTQHRLLRDNIVKQSIHNANQKPKQTKATQACNFCLLLYHQANTKEWDRRAIVIPAAQKEDLSTRLTHEPPTYTCSGPLHQKTFSLTTGSNQVSQS